MSIGTALVTGASAGIGQALAREFAGRNYDLIITARSEDRLRELADELSSDVHVEVVAADLAAQEGPATLVDALARLDCEVDVLVNNAGTATPGRFQELDPEQIEYLMSLNMHSVTLLIHHILPTMIQRGAGRILNVASVAAFQPIPGLSLYAASKAFVLSLSEAISEEVRGTGVSVTALCPGITRSGAGEGLDQFVITTPEDVAREGYEALMDGEAVRIPGLANQAAVTWARLQPRWMVRGLGGLVSRLIPGNYRTGS